MKHVRVFRYALLAYFLCDWLVGYAGLLPMLTAQGAGFTTVTGTVTDPNGLPYANGTITATLVISGTPVFVAAAGGGPYTPPTQPAGLDLSGRFTLQLADNTQLLPGGSTWNFTVSCGAGCVPPAGGKGSVTFSLAAPITISGASQDISAQLQAAAQPLTSASGAASLFPTATTATEAVNTVTLTTVSGTFPAAYLPGATISVLGCSVAGYNISAAIASGGAGTSSLTYTDPTGALGPASGCTANVVIGSTTPTFNNVLAGTNPNALLISGTLAPTGAGTISSNLLAGLTSAAFVATNGGKTPVAAPCTAAQILVGNVGNLAVCQPLTGDSTITNAGVMTNTKINGVAFSALGTGILKNTTGTGVPSIAAAPDFPILNQNTTGNATTATTATNFSGALAGDVTGTQGATTVSKLNGVAISGIPAVGQVPTATSSTASVWANQSANTLTAAGPNPWTDLSSPGYGAIGDGKMGNTGRITGTAVTLNTPGPQWTFSAGDVGKVLAIAGNPFATGTTLGAATPQNNGSGKLATGTSSFGGSVNVTYCLFLVPIDDNATMPQGIVNGTGVKSNEVCATVTPPNNSISFPAPTIDASATGYRVYAVDQEQLLSVSSGAGTCTNGTYIVHFPGSGTNAGQGAIVQVVVTGGTTLTYTVVAPGRGYNAAPAMPTFAFCSGQPAAPVITVGGNLHETMQVAGTTTDHVKCATQSAANIRDNACDVSGGFVLYRDDYTGAPASTTGLWLTKITVFNSGTSVTVADSIPAAIGSNTNIAWGTDNSAVFSTAYAAITALIANTTLGAPRGAKFCFPPVGTTNAPTGRYFALGGFRIPYGNGAVVSGSGTGVPANIELSTCGGTTPRSFVQVDSNVPGTYGAGGEAAILGAIGQDYALHIGACGGNCTPEVPGVAVPTNFIMSSGGAIRGVSIHDIGVEDPLTTSSLGGVFVDGDWGPSNIQSDNITVERVYAGNFCAGEMFVAAGTEIDDFRYNQGMGLVAYHFRDDVSDVTAIHGRFASCRQTGLLNAGNTPGLGWGIIAENNPIGTAGAAPGNNRFMAIRIMDEYEGYCRLTDQQSSYCGNAGKQEQNSLAGGACGGKCWGTPFFIDSAALGGNHCKNNAVEMSQVAKVADLYQVGPTCDSTDIFEIGGQQIMSLTQGSPLFAYVDNGTNTDNLPGNAVNNVSPALSIPSGYLKDAGILQQLGANTSTVSVANPPTISIFNGSTGPSSWTLPGGNASGHCWIQWQQNTGLATVLIGIRTTGFAPINMRVTGYANTATGGAFTPFTPVGNITTIGATLLATLTPAVIATPYDLYMDFTIEAVAGTVLFPTFSTSNAADAAVSLRDSYCALKVN